MKKVFLLLVLSLPTTMLSQGRPSEATQNRYIQGEVRLPDGRPAGIGLYVTLESDASGGFLNTQTDSRGKFSFNGLANVRYRVKVRAPGYEEEVEEIDLSITPVGFLKISLRPKAGSGPQPVSGTVNVNPRFPDDMPESARKEFQQGLDIFTSGKDQHKSISHFKKSADAYPKFAPTFYYLGAAEAINKDVDAAVPALQKSLELNDKSVEALIALGSLYTAQKKYGDAEKLLARAVELAPESFDAHEALAKALLPDLPRTPETEAHLKKAVALNDKSVEAHILLGNVFLRQRKQQEALHEYETALHLDPKGPMAGPVKEMISKLEKSAKAESK